MTDVVIAGGGPNGLMLACEIALAGVRPTVLERRPEPSPDPKANGMVGRVVQAMDYRGLYERITGGDGPPVAPPSFPFAAFPLPLSELPDHSLFALPIPQRRLEELLAARAAELGIEIRRGHEVTGLAQHDDEVEVEIAGPDGAYSVRAGHLVGADGGRSTVRKLAGIGFPGTTNDSTVSRTGSVTLPAGFTDPATGDLSVPGFGHIRHATFTRTERGVLAYGRFRADAHILSTLEWGGPEFDENTPMTLAELREAVHRVLGVDIPLELAEVPDQVTLRRLAGRNTRQADRYREGRVLLVGDAAHVFSATGGPGLNLGLQDAMNLGWKLAAQVHGWAPPGLLDTYHGERHPVGARVLLQTKAQTALLAPGPEVTALRELFGELLADRVTVRRIADLMAGADIRYDMGDKAPHELTGRWLPDLALETESGPTRVAKLMRNARPLLLDLGADPAVTEIAAGWRDRVDVVAARHQDPPAAALLARPDGYVAWACDPGDTEVHDGLVNALTTWFGEPS